MKTAKQITFLILISILVGFKNLPVKENLNGASDPGIEVIINSANPITELTIKQLRAYLKGELVRWPNKQKVIIAVMKSNTTIGKQTAKLVLNMSANDMDQFYLTMVFQGKITAPKTFESTEELKTFVANNPGAIGITGEGQANELIKIVKVEGQTTINQ